MYGVVGYLPRTEWFNFFPSVLPHVQGGFVGIVDFGSGKYKSSISPTQEEAKQSAANLAIINHFKHMQVSSNLRSPNFSSQSFKFSYSRAKNIVHTKQELFYIKLRYVDFQLPIKASLCLEAGQLMHKIRMFCFIQSYSTLYWSFLLSSNFTRICFSLCFLPSATSCFFCSHQEVHFSLIPTTPHLLLWDPPSLYLSIPSWPEVPCSNTPYLQEFRAPRELVAECLVHSFLFR